MLTCADVEKTVEFYSKLGMERVVFGAGRLALAFGSQKFNLHQAGAEIKPHAKVPQRGSADLCLLVNGRIDDVVTHLATVNIPIELGPVPRTGAVHHIMSVYVRDPDGNLIELAEERGPSKL